MMPRLTALIAAAVDAGCVASALELEGGTTFTFVTNGIEAALELAMCAAGDKDVSRAGGASTAQRYLAAGVVDEMEINVVPTLLGSGERLFDGVGDNLHGLDLVRRPVAFCFAWNLTIPLVRVATFGNFVYEPLGAFIMGGTTFASLADYWPTKTGAEEPLAECMNSIEKLVCSRTIETTGWSNSRVLAGDIGASVGSGANPGKTS